MSFTVATVNVNGIRAAVRRGMLDWLSARCPDAVAIQEVRGPESGIGLLLGHGWHVVHAGAATKGRAGVAIASRSPMRNVVGHLDADGADSSGRWIEATVDMGTERHPFDVTLISAYVHTGDAGDPLRMREKLSFLDAAVERVVELAGEGHRVLLTGDLNVARTQADIKNWKGNLGKAGFLEVERQRLDRLVDAHHWTDLGRSFGGDGPGPYTWWSYRGKAFDNDAGWRIDYQFASPGLAQHVDEVTVDRSATYGDRWSDHAPLTAVFDLGGRGCPPGSNGIH